MRIAGYLRRLERCLNGLQLLALPELEALLPSLGTRRGHPCLTLQLARGRIEPGTGAATLVA